jgi:hypothetical protein
MALESLPGIADVHRVGGSIGGPDATGGVDLFIEVPHGATHTSDFQEVASSMESPLPPGLVDFFYVNTDVGAFELAMGIAQRYVELDPSATVEVLRCRIPRTFIDCNRRIDATAEEYRKARVTPGVPPWVTSPADLAVLMDRYQTYLELSKARLGRLSESSTLLLLHTYSPRSVGVQVDLDIVETLRREYAPENFSKWPLRPEFDAITTDTEGTSFAPKALLEALRAELDRGGWSLADSATYPLHPSTIAWDRVMNHPGAGLCLEVRRDLLADPFDPFVEMTICNEKVDRIATRLASALASPWSSGVS